MPALVTEPYCTPPTPISTTATTSYDCDEYDYDYTHTYTHTFTRPHTPTHTFTPYSYTHAQPHTPTTSLTHTLLHTHRAPPRTFTPCWSFVWDRPTLYCSRYLIRSRSSSSTPSALPMCCFMYSSISSRAFSSCRFRLSCVAPVTSSESARPFFCWFCFDSSRVLVESSEMPARRLLLPQLLLARPQLPRRRPHLTLRPDQQPVLLRHPRPLHRLVRLQLPRAQLQRRVVRLHRGDARLGERERREVAAVGAARGVVLVLELSEGGGGERREWREWREGREERVKAERVKAARRVEGRR